ncbi:hypothetical protein V8G54_031343 [Vigna mungo]|uniref:Uncharacterized protein n=1 Tax=Vigna mungo TaxID=3915 RepID=A0AAQ3RN68_VIGMU
MKGDCYNELVEVFYYNVKEVNGNIHSRVKGVDIIINDDIWLKFVGLRNEGRYSTEKGFLFKWLDKEEKVVAFIIGHILLPGRCNIKKLTFVDFCLLYAIECKIQTNCVVVFKEHILEVGTCEWHRLPYGVNLTGENKQTCGKKNMIGKVTLTCIGMKRTSQGWIFSDEDDSLKRKESSVNQDSDQEFGPPNSEFEIRVNDRFKRT